MPARTNYSAEDHTRLWEHFNALGLSINERDAAWTTWAPSWTQSGNGAALSIGNGTMQGWSKQIGSLIVSQLTWVRGTTTNQGNGGMFWLWSGYPPMKTHVFGGIIGSGMGVINGQKTTINVDPTNSTTFAVTIPYVSGTAVRQARVGNTPGGTADASALGAGDYFSVVFIHEAA